ncbi:MAG: helix-turn-helix transcriptional regulator [Clostridiales bacterium]|nr:helix-turn-helix transcriptional regulator [Clostridiales bacterium]
MLNSIIDLLLFIETAFLLAVLLLSSYLYFKTHDAFIKRTLLLIVPIFIIFIYSYGYTYVSRFFTSFSFAFTENWLNFTLFNALFLVFVIGVLIIGINTYATNLYPIPNKNKKISKEIIYVLTFVFLIFGSFFTIMKEDLVSSLPLVLNVIFPLCSLIAFVHATIIIFYFKKIKAPSQNRLVKNFITAFILQAPFTFIDIFLFNNYSVSFRFTHISYFLFALLTIYYIFSKHFISTEKTSIPEYFNQKISVYDLSEREVDVLNLLLLGKNNKEIAIDLFISVNTVKTHVKNIYHKVHVNNRLSLSYLFIQKNKKSP